MGLYLHSPHTISWCETALQFNAMKDKPPPQLGSFFKFTKIIRATYEQKCCSCYNRGCIHFYTTFWCARFENAEGMSINIRIMQHLRKPSLPEKCRLMKIPDGLHMRILALLDRPCSAQLRYIPQEHEIFSDLSSQNEYKFNAEVLCLWRYSAPRFSYRDIQATRKETFWYLIKLHIVSSRKRVYIHSR
jgi:hypothetical protein